jgi:hypothetical protein
MSEYRCNDCAAGRRTLPVIGAILVVGAALTAGLLAARHPQDRDEAPQPAGNAGESWSSTPLPPTLFRGWPAGKKPDVALILTGQQHSYLKFCGCTKPQLGGFERRFNFMAKLRQQGWPLVAADLGDLVQRSGENHDLNRFIIPEQTYLKCDIEMQALRALGYTAMTLGDEDYLLPLDQGVAQFFLQNGNAFPRTLVVNLDNKAAQYPSAVPNKSWIDDWQAAGGNNGTPRIGFVGLTGKSVIKKVTTQDPNVQFMPHPKNKADEPKSMVELRRVLAEMNNAKVDLKVLLFQGSLEEAKIICGPTVLPNTFDVILCLSGADIPPAQPEMVGKTMLVNAGHRGKYVCVVGAFRTGNAAKPFDIFYDAVAMGESFETDKDKEANHPILKILDRYAQDVRGRDFAKRVVQQQFPAPANLGNVQLNYVGSQKCAECHGADFAIWKKTKHQQAFDALTKVADKPRLRQYDPECVSCHVTGYGYKSGYDGTKATDLLKNVNCENCHGPGSAHVLAPNNMQFRLAMSPWKGNNPNAVLPLPAKLQQGFEKMNQQEQAIFNRVNDMCQKCHDPENDPHFKFDVNWPQIIHGRNAKAPIPAPGTAAQNKPGP